MGSRDKNANAYFAPQLCSPIALRSHWPTSALTAQGKFCGSESNAIDACSWTPKIPGRRWLIMSFTLSMAAFSSKAESPVRVSRVLRKFPTCSGRRATGSCAMSLISIGRSFTYRYVSDQKGVACEFNLTLRFSAEGDALVTPRAMIH